MAPSLLYIQPTLDDDAALALRAGEAVRITGELLTARDAACMRLVEAIDAGRPLPVKLEGRVIYAVGPTPGKPGQIIGSAGPTTITRLRPFVERLFDAGVRGLIGKGDWGQSDAGLFRDRGVYFAAIGGLGALIARTIKRVAVVAYEDLGPEAIHVMEVVDFPCTVAMDRAGNNFHKAARRAWARPEQR